MNYFEVAENKIPYRYDNVVNQLTYIFPQYKVMIISMGNEIRKLSSNCGKVAYVH